MSDAMGFALWAVAWAAFLSLAFVVAWWTGAIEADPARLTVEEAHELSLRREAAARAAHPAGRGR